MNKFECFLAEPLINTKQVKKFEDMYCIFFPNDFIECIIENNSGYFVQKKIKTKFENIRICNNFLNFYENDKISIFYVYKDVFFEREIDRLIPFAQDPFGNYFCFDFSDSSMSVVFWEHESSKKEYICNTFTEFINNLYK